MEFTQKNEEKRTTPNLFKTSTDRVFDPFLDVCLENIKPIVGVLTSLTLTTMLVSRLAASASNIPHMVSPQRALINTYNEVQNPITVKCTMVVSTMPAWKIKTHNLLIEAHRAPTTKSGLVVPQTNLSINLYFVNKNP